MSPLIVVFHAETRLVRPVCRHDWIHEGVPPCSQAAGMQPEAVLRKTGALGGNIAAEAAAEDAYPGAGGIPAPSAAGVAGVAGAAGAAFGGGGALILVPTPGAAGVPPVV